MSLLEFMRYTHSGVRWLVVVVTIVALVWMVYGLVKNRPYDDTARKIMTAFSSLVGLQWIIGIIFMVIIGSQVGMFVRQQWEHAGTMTFVLVLAHVHMMLKRRDDRARYIGGLVSVVLSLALVYVGVAVIGGW